MPITYISRRDTEKGGYGTYLAYLVSFDTESIKTAMCHAIPHYSHIDDPWVTGLLKAASSSGDSEYVTIEQGSPLPKDDTPGGSLCLHFTGRYKGRVFHLYVEQGKDAQLRISGITCVGDTGLKRYEWR